MSIQIPEIHLSDAAVTHILSYLSKDPAYIGLRFSVKPTGCSGLSYVVDYVKDPREEDLKAPLTDKYSIYIDNKSYPFIKNMHIDYVKQGLNSKFIFNNPNETGQCGCGESFTVDVRE